MTTSKKLNAATMDPCVANARMAEGLDTIVRCGSTDGLAINKPRSLGFFDNVILKRAGLILDLRSGSERNETEAQSWMDSVEEPLVAQEISALDSHSESTLEGMLRAHGRLVVRLDILSPRRFKKYLEENWLSPDQRAQAEMFRMQEKKTELNWLRRETINKRGLLGLNEAILETGKQGLCTALQLITLHLERVAKRQCPYDLIVIHCVQGKDRTGVLAMLCQAIVGVPDYLIVEDYSKSHKNFPNTTSAAMERVTATTTTKFKPASRLARSLYHSAPPQVMQSTLDYLRSKYGSIAPGYLDNIGFDASWQQTFRAVANVPVSTSSRIGRSNL